MREMKYHINYSKKFRGFLTTFSIDFLGKTMSFQCYDTKRIGSLYMATNLYKDLLLLEQKYNLWRQSKE